jgi:hypothetical protein
MITVGVRFQDGTEKVIGEYERVVEANDSLTLSLADYPGAEYLYLEMAGYDVSADESVVSRYAKLYPNDA